MRQPTVVFEHPSDDKRHDFAYQKSENLMPRFEISLIDPEWFHDDPACFLIHEAYVGSK